MTSLADHNNFDDDYWSVVGMHSLKQSRSTDDHIDDDDDDIDDDEDDDDHSSSR